MWSLPDIKKLNEEAELKWKGRKSLKPEQILKGHTCEHCDNPATMYFNTYDIFSDVPKSQIFLCNKHDGYYMSPPEGYFICDECNRVFIENYTWESYSHTDEDGEVCLNCYFDREIKNKENWIKSVKEITMDRVRKAKHLIPVSGTHWKKYLKFIGNTELDSSSGKKITGSSSTSSVDDGLNELRDLVKVALKNKKECIFILDGAYQFAVSIGVYIKK